MKYVPLHKRLQTDIAEKLKTELKVTNLNALPKIKKVLVNVGLNQKKYSSKEMIQFISDSVTTVTGQKPALRKSKKSISDFNIREGMVVGMTTTLRGPTMENFLDRLVHYVLPRIRDFRGLSTKLDGHGNYSIGIVDQSIFPELPAPEANKIFGMQIQITTSAGNDKAGMALLKHIGLPFKRVVTKSPSPKK